MVSTLAPQVQVQVYAPSGLLDHLATKVPGYSKGKLVQEAGIETYYFLISSKKAL